MAIHTCQHCSRIVLPVHKEEFWNRLHISLSYDDVLAASRDKCLLFQKITPRITECLQESGELGTGAIAQLKIVFQMRMDTEDLEIFLSTEDQYLRLTYFQTFCEPTDDAAEYISTRPVNHNRGSTKTFEMAKSWISQCLSSHRHPSHPHDHISKDSPFAPKRLLHLIRIGCDYEIQLMERESHPGHFSHSYITNDDGEDARLEGVGECDSFLGSSKEQRHFVAPVAYTALSYCWGGEQPDVLTSGNITCNPVFSYNSLPKTIQDAVKVSYELGYTYLWVDSLCLVQDDPVELAQEIAMMPSVYSNAVVTISASSSSAVNEGFLEVKNQEEFQNSIFRLQFAPYGGTVSSVLAVWEPHHLEPLHCRAWAFQEALSSTRILDYGTHQLRFFCQDTARNFVTDLCDGWRQAHSENGLQRILEYWSDVRRNQTYIWDSMVGEYTKRRLTVQKDRIVAISSIASIISTRHPAEEYIAGHWKSALPGTLLWFIKNDQDQRPEEFQGPTWSWTGVNGIVSFELARNVPERDWHRAELISHEVVLAERSAPFGAVKQAVLTLRGLLKPVTQIRCSLSDGILSWKPPKYQGAYSVRIYADFLEVDEILSQDQLYLFIVAVNADVHEAEGLILQSKEGEGRRQRYTRVTMFVNSPNERRRHRGMDKEECALQRQDFSDFMRGFEDSVVELE